MEDGAEHNKHECVSGRHPEGQAKDAVRGEDSDLDKVLVADLAVLQHATQIVAPQIVGNKDEDEDRKPHPRGPAGEF